MAGIVLALGVAGGVAAASPAWALGLDPAFPDPLLGPAHAKGVVVWSHGRSINAEDSQAHTPIYLEALRDDGWDIMRFDRLSQGDTLKDSSKRLVDYSAELKQKGYKQVALAGQSFGAFLALMAADASNDVDTVIATAPAAYGNFDDFYESWQSNASRLYPLLEEVKHARVMVFYFHGDDFDPGGRGEHSRQILAQRGLTFAVIDQPAYLTGHWASSSGLFLRRFGDCIRDFADNAALTGEQRCNPRWGTMPSAEMKLPPELADPPPQPLAKRVAASPTGSAAAPDGGNVPPHGLRDVWYGFYPNGREILFGIEAAHGDDLTAIYAIGPSIDNKNPAAWSRRKGHIVKDVFVFDEPGKSTLRFRPKQDGGLGATWMSIDHQISMTAHLKPIDPQIVAEHAANMLDSAPDSAPVAPAAANSDGSETEH
ncbi:MAG TPA: alpha/beta hydrolase [Stellaceae bacterium]|jgi:pimeloyl-ACP methyl ester carboxylesterase|nr:alpha/beta hydrolase [Stellaceae bacterium]